MRIFLASCWTIVDQTSLDLSAEHSPIVKDQTYEGVVWPRTGYPNVTSSKLVMPSVTDDGLEQAIRYVVKEQVDSLGRNESLNSRKFFDVTTL